MENIKVSQFANFFEKVPVREVFLIEWLKDESIKAQVRKIFELLQIKNHVINLKLLFRA